MTRRHTEDQSSVPSVHDVLTSWEEERGLSGPERRAVYVSTPITSGRLFLEWYRERGMKLEAGSRDYEESLRANVILPNTQRAARYVELIRWSHAGLVIDPRSLEVPGWTQIQYHRFWSMVMERQARRVIFLDGWEASRGCTLEFVSAKRSAIDCVDADLAPLSITKGVELISQGISEANNAGLDKDWIDRQRKLLSTLKTLRSKVESGPRRLFKDEVLDRLAETANVAQFASFDPSLEQRHSRILGFEANHTFSDPGDAVRALLKRSPENKVNIRSFDPESPEHNPFLKDLSSTSNVLAHLRKLANEEGLYTIVNELIDEQDGGVSGVAYRNVLEFSPDATPRVVDDPDAETTILPFEIGMHLLKSVYSFEPDLRGREGARIEFSIHPQARGWNHQHTIIWQSEQRPAQDLTPAIVWPTAFSRMIGDKAFGLALASSAGLPVPQTIVFTDRLFPFSFGRSVGTKRLRTRTAPPEKIPGYFPSSDEWHDPFQVLANPWDLLLGSKEKSADQHNDGAIASVLIQEHIDARFSGRLLPANQGLKVDGVAGGGEEFMLGRQASESLPSDVKRKVSDLYDAAQSALGPVGIEWVYDGTIAWIVQVNRHERQGFQEPPTEDWIEFRYRKGRLEDFRALVEELAGTGKGIEVYGNVSPLSHLGEIADQHAVPARFRRIETPGVET